MIVIATWFFPLLSLTIVATMFIWERRHLLWERKLYRVLKKKELQESIDRCTGPYDIIVEAQVYYLTINQSIIYDKRARAHTVCDDSCFITIESISFEFFLISRKTDQRRQFDNQTWSYSRKDPLQEWTHTIYIICKDCPTWTNSRKDPGMDANSWNY